MAAVDPQIGEEEELPRFSLEILAVIKQAQAANGLRHGDYQRYQQYCSRRLKRIRKSKRFHYGRGRNFVNKQLTPELVVDSGLLSMPLINAERAWSFAMQLKQESEYEPRKHFHLVRRFSKAAHWANILRELCAERGDARTSLEAEAYAAWMKGTELLEREGWAGASEAFAASKRIYDQLAAASDGATAALYRTTVEEIEPLLMYCRHCVAQLGGDDSGGDALRAMNLPAVHGPAGDLLQAKLEAVMAESRRKQASVVTTVSWLGESAPVREEAIRVSVLQATDLLFSLQRLKDAQSGGDGDATATAAGDGEAGKQAEAAADSAAGAADADARSSIFTQVLAAFDDALRAAATARKAATAKGQVKAESLLAELAVVESYLRACKLRVTLRRNRMLLSSLRTQFAAQQSGAKAGTSAVGKKKLRAKDLIHMYDRVSQNLRDLLALPGASEHPPLAKECATRLLAASAGRCYFAAEAYANEADWPSAHALYQRSAEVAGDAVSHAHDWASTIAATAAVAATRGGDGDGSGSQDDGVAADISPQALTAQLEAFHATARGAVARCVGQSLLETAEARQAPTAAAAAAASAGGETAYLMQRLCEFESGAEEKDDPYRILPIPPKLEAIPCKPLLFDTAFNCLAAPDLTARLSKRQRREEEKRQEVASVAHQQEEQGEGAAAAAAGGGGFFGWWRR